LVSLDLKFLIIVVSTYPHEKHHFPHTLSLLTHRLFLPTLATLPPFNLIWSLSGFLASCCSLKKKIGRAYTKHAPNCLIDLNTFVIFNQSKRVFGWRGAEISCLSNYSLKQLNKLYYVLLFLFYRVFLPNLTLQIPSHSFVNVTFFSSTNK
jgi:hypothetical protein